MGGHWEERALKDHCQTVEASFPYDAILAELRSGKVIHELAELSNELSSMGELLIHECSKRRHVRHDLQRSTNPTLGNQAARPSAGWPMRFDWWVGVGYSEQLQHSW